MKRGAGASNGKRTEREARRAARRARLRHVNDGEPGIARRRRGRGFSYRDAATGRAPSAARRREIEALAIPPAWTDVWICRDADGHLQATGRDARGRKQYRYHPDWRAVRDEAKFDRMAAFGALLPRIRRRVRRDLATRGLTRERVAAAAVRLLDETGVRIGSERYRDENGSFGLTTLRDRHASFSGDRTRLRFRGKGGALQEVEVDDGRLARLVRNCRDLPGQELFQYVDDEGERHTLHSHDVNAYLGAIAEGVTAKDFRTWHGTLVAIAELCAQGCPERVAERDRAILAAIDRAASFLGNTRSVCRSFYVHPELVERFRQGRLPIDAAFARGRRRSGLHAAEVRLLELLEGGPDAA